MLFYLSTFAPRIAAVARVPTLPVRDRTPPSSSACEWDSRIMAEIITSADLAVAALQAIERRF
jgi:hypothetical protein